MILPYLTFRIIIIIIIMDDDDDDDDDDHPLLFLLLFNRRSFLVGNKRKGIRVQKMTSEHSFANQKA